MNANLHKIIIFISQIILISSSVFVPKLTFIIKNENNNILDNECRILSLLNSYDKKQEGLFDALQCRGGSEEYDEYEEDNNDDTDNETSKTKPSKLSEEVVSDTISTIGKGVIKYGLYCLEACMKVTNAGIDAIHTIQEDDADIENNLSDRLKFIIQRMMTALFDSSDDDGSSTKTSKEDKGTDKTPTKNSVILPSNLSFEEALQISKESSRLLIVYIPCSNDKSKYNIKAKESLHTFEFQSSSNKKLSKDFYIWMASTPNMKKKLEKKITLANKKSSTPTLIVLYPHQKLDVSTNSIKIFPKLLVQHHCNPPPSITSFTAWLKTIRKRHAKLYKRMHHDAKEQSLYAERTANYQQSKVMDEQRHIQEEKVKQQKEEEIQKEKLRRENLLQLLPAEPDDQEEHYTIALRFMNATNTTSSLTRKFPTSSKMKDIFYWIDAMFFIHYERIKLITMNGKQEFILNDVDDTQDELIQDILFQNAARNMCALRVLQLADDIENDDAVKGKSQVEEKDDDDDDDSSDDDYDS